MYARMQLQLFNSHELNCEQIDDC